jgi:hypothetical protein
MKYDSRSCYPAVEAVIYRIRPASKPQERAVPGCKDPKNWELGNSEKAGAIGNIAYKLSFVNWPATF